MNFVRGPRGTVLECIGSRERRKAASPSRPRRTPRPSRFCLVLTFILRSILYQNLSYSASIAANHQRPPPTKQPNRQRIQGSAVCGNDVQEYAAVGGHLEYPFPTKPKYPIRLQQRNNNLRIPFVCVIRFLFHIKHSS